MGLVNPILKHLIFLMVLGFSSTAHGTQLYSPDLEAYPGEKIKIPIMVDRVDNLSGVKIVLTYDPELLIYEGSAKTERSSSLMHIVNDKKPGVLILVMAGARGIKGEDFSLFDLYFKVSNPITRSDRIKAPIKTQIELKEIQIMEDDLNEVECRFEPINIKIGKE